jgi:FkbM family methyltransferase
VGCPDAGRLAGVNDAGVNHEDTSFQHYTLRHRITAWISQNLFGNFVYTSGHGLTKGLRRKGGLGWLPEFLSRSVETEEHRFWLSLDLKGKVVYDVGSFQGLLALYFARTARAVICYEPNDSNRRRLIENIALNNMRQITVRPVGIGSEPGSATMYHSPLMSGGASVDHLTVQTLRKQPVVQQVIEITTLDREVASGSQPPPDFIKIDIEGYELAALEGARETILQFHPELFLEMHGETIREKKEKVRAITDFLMKVHYSILHVETGTKIHPGNSEVAMEGHLYATPTRF